MRRVRTVFILAALFGLATPSFPAEPEAMISATERAALIAFFEATNGLSWTDYTDWKIDAYEFSPPGTECSWYGVTCNRDPSVTRIELPQNYVVGILPAALADLPNLTHLELMNNKLQGGIPPAIGDLTNLIYLGLQANQLTGGIPSEITNLTNLPTGGAGLALGWNALSSDDPAVKAFVDSCHIYNGGYAGTWESTQTLAPENVVVTSATDATVWLSWDLIEYTADNGGYEFWQRESGTSQEWRNAGWTWDKNVTSYPIAGLKPGTTYDIRVGSFTYSHENNPSNVNSNRFVAAIETTTNFGCAAPRMFVPGGDFPRTLSLIDSYSTYAWITGETDPAIVVNPSADNWYWVEVSWPGPCLETASAHVDPLRLFVTEFATGDTSDWSRVVGEH